MAAASSSSSSTDTVDDGFKYDVFLSFRGEDTRFGFTGSLWKALDDKGIRTFFDEEDIHKGDEITPFLLQSIQLSRMALVVLSPNYASSSFCLDELSHILNCIRGNGRLVWPIFYEVDPSDVRKLKGTYGDAMAKHEANSRCSMDRLEKWKAALQQVANFAGTHFKEGDKYLYKFIEEIVVQVSTKIKPLPLHISDNKVGLGPRMKDVISLLNLGSDDEIRMVGIHGIGGVGKTTLALAVYNSIASQFQCSCYLENVRENFEKHGLTYLQKIILSETVKEKKIELTSSKQGVTIIKQRLGQKKVLLVLDDVDKLEQLEAIAGSRDWFGPGSRVIITTRDTRLLTCHDVESKYEVNELSKEDASELLTQKAFKTNKVSPCYLDVFSRALTYASGHPLALEVIGSHFFNKTLEQCKSALARYEKIPDQKIQTILEVSFNALAKEEKCVFLDIACVFKGHKLPRVEKQLHAHYGDSKKHHIDVLVEKSLIKISEYGQIKLHDLIADMGEEIVRQESPDDPGRRSRLWLSKDVVQVLEENKGTSKIEIIYFQSLIELNASKIDWNGEAFKKMENLKTLIFKCHTSLNSPKHLPNSLRVLKWWNYPGDAVPSDFYPKKLAICKFGGNSTSLMREDFFKKKFANMRILKVKECDFLTQIPDISGLLNLEEFSIKYCDSLIRIDDSVGLLDKLRSFSLNGCDKLKSIPPLKLPSLEELHFQFCDGLDSFPLVVDGILGKLKKLSFIGCGNLKSFPLLELPLLESLKLGHCPSLENFPSLDGLLGNLTILRISQCNKIRSIPPLELPSLEELLLSHCDGIENFSPVVHGLLGKLKVLIVLDCKNLKSIQSLKLPLLEKLELSYCNSLESFPSLDGLLGNLTILRISHCYKIRSIPPLEWPSLEELLLSHCDGIESFSPVVHGLLGKLKVLIVQNCKNLKSIQSLKLPLLEKLELSDCNSLESFPSLDGLLGNLTILRISHCYKIRSIPPLEWPSLEELLLSHCDGIESFSPVVHGLLGKLKVLIVQNCKNLESIQSLKLPSLEKLKLSYCNSLESFPVMMDGSLGKLKSLTVVSCKNLKSFLQLKLASPETLELRGCGGLEIFLRLVYGWMEKLEVLQIMCCRNHRSIPPITFASLEELELPCDSCQDDIPKIGELHWDDTPLKELPFSFQDFHFLQTLDLMTRGIVQFPTSSIVAMSKRDKGEEKVIPIQSSSRVELCLRNCKLSDESLAIGLKWFSNVKELDLSCSNFTTLPECIKNCYCLCKLVVDYCEKLQEIKGIPPKVKTISAFNCSSLTSLCRSKLLNQELHEFGNTNFILPGVEIPNWFDREYMQGLPISFWFRNNFPAIALCLVSPMICINYQVYPKVTINGNEYSYKDDIHTGHYDPNEYHLWLFHMQNQKFNFDPDIELLENKWNHVVVNFEFGVFKSGIHVLKKKSNMEDIRFDNPENDVTT